MPRPDRKDILLRAAYDIIRKADLSRYVVSPTETEVFYDDAMCDGSCLMNDIAHELRIDDQAMPLEAPADHWTRKEVRNA